MSSEPHSRITPAKAGAICNRLGMAILVVGLALAAWIWQTQGHQTEDPLPSTWVRPLSPDDSAKYQHQVEIYSGKVGILVEKWTRQAAELSPGKPLAETLAVLAVVGAGSCFLLASMLKRLRHWPSV